MSNICFNLADFRNNKEFFYLSLWTSTFVKLNERNFFPTKLKIFQAYQRVKIFLFKGILNKKCRNQFDIFEPADNLNKLQRSVSIVFSYSLV